MDENRIIRQTQTWINRVVVGLNFCPFARREVLSNKIRYRVSPPIPDKKTLLDTLEQEFQILDNQPDIPTSFLIIPQGHEDFQLFWRFVQMADKAIARSPRRGVYQLANFHPQYQFADSDESDPANYTNRAPYPMLHLLREAELGQAIDLYPDTRLIPQRNIELARQKGLDFMQQLRQSCLDD